MDIYRAKVVEVNINNNDYGEIRVYIPELMDLELDTDIDSSKNGLIALPGNNPIGGRNTENVGSYGYGTVMVPRVGSWVWVFAEERLSQLYYFNSIDIKNSKLPPENRNVENPSEVYTIIRSQSGRVILVADSPDVQRVEITGKKRGGGLNNPSADDQDSYTIDGNQTTILLDEREGKEKILIKTYKGDFLNIDIETQKLNAFFEGGIIIKTEGDFHLSVGGKMEESVDGNIRRTAGGYIHDKSDSYHALDSPKVLQNSSYATKAFPESPVGDR